MKKLLIDPLFINNGLQISIGSPNKITKTKKKMDVVFFPDHTCIVFITVDPHENIGSYIIL